MTEEELICNFNDVICSFDSSTEIEHLNIAVKYKRCLKNKESSFMEQSEGSTMYEFESRVLMVLRERASRLIINEFTVCSYCAFTKRRWEASLLATSASRLEVSKGPRRG